MVPLEDQIKLFNVNQTLDSAHIEHGPEPQTSVRGTWMMENNQCQVLNLKRVQALETWLKTTDTKLTQVNGQRKYGGPPDVWDGPTPGARCEVFISQIPRDAYEDLLIPLFSSVGPIWEFRLMMNFSGQNRGFAYAKYSSSGVAADAVRLLHGHMLEPGFRLSVRRSTEKRHLCIGDLPAATRQEELLQVLRVLAEGVERVSLKAGPGIEGVSAIVAFSSHHAASMAKKILVEGSIQKAVCNDRLNQVAVNSESEPGRATATETSKEPPGVTPEDAVPHPEFSTALSPASSSGPPSIHPPGFLQSSGRTRCPRTPSLLLHLLFFLLPGASSFCSIPSDAPA
ncbi:dead end protein 1 isoform X2 [Xiphias gladius]|uniref:dead end protein 1 isoform X2 n=1 Tax=Xiphias gladius TaxID=8245 RepID=UPI001A9897FE|nr:dead end protein 1 isoform X2 [Xiphias gladius]